MKLVHWKNNFEHEMPTFQHHRLKLLKLFDDYHSPRQPQWHADGKCRSPLTKNLLEWIRLGKIRNETSVFFRLLIFQYTSLINYFISFCTPVIKTKMFYSCNPLKNVCSCGPVCFQFMLFASQTIKWNTGYWLVAFLWYTMLWLLAQIEDRIRRTQRFYLW